MQHQGKPWGLTKDFYCIDRKQTGLGAHTTKHRLSDWGTAGNIVLIRVVSCGFTISKLNELKGGEPLKNDNLSPQVMFPSTSIETTMSLAESSMLFIS